MSKLTRAQAKAHREACDLLQQDHLTLDERVAVLENWREDAEHVNSAAGAFFTPYDLARSFSIEVGFGGAQPCRVLDLCAGIGALSFHLFGGMGVQPLVTCVEVNADYAAVGRKVVPEAEWIVADVFDLPADLGPFDFVIGNPPFGAIKRSATAPRFSGAEFEYHVIDVASDLGAYGVFIIPQGSAPFRYSGEPSFRKEESDRYRRFVQQTGIELEPSCGIDTDFARTEWRGTSPKVEVVTVDFAESRRARPPAQSDLFGVAA